jgi:DNA sulfur modification protein DndD
MILTELTLENFGPYREKQIINLRPENEQKLTPIILFGGMNGGGKTTLIDAIRLAFYGQRAQCSTRGNLSYNQFLNQCINQKILPHQQTRIELAFEHIVNDRWVDLKIVRYWTKNLKDGKDNLGIIQGEWPVEDLANSWDEYIENILPLGISNLFLFDGEQVKELAEEEIPTPPVVESIKSLLGLELAERLAIDLDVFITRKQKKLASASQLATLEEIEVKLSELEQKKKNILANLKIHEDRLKIAQKNYKQAANKFRIQGGKLASETEYLKNKEKQYNADLENFRAEIRYLAGSKLPLCLIIEQLKEIKLQGEKELKYQQAKIAQDLLKEKDKRLLDYLKNISLDPQHFQKIKDFLNQENDDFNENLDSVFPYLEINQKNLQDLQHTLEYILPNQQKTIQDKLGEISNLERQIEETERLLVVAASPETYQKLEEELKKAEQDIINCRTNWETNNQKLTSLERKINETKKQLNQYSEKAIAIHNSQHLFDSIDKVKKTLTVFKEKLTLRKLNKLELEITECFRYLLHKSNLVNRVTIDSNNFALSLYDRQSKIVPKNRLSAGEKQLLAIALLWGLARVSGKNLPILIDTPLGRLDSSHRNNLVERYFPTASHQVILFSTDTEIGQKEVKKLREKKAIAREYLLEFDAKENQTTIKEGYFG